MIIQITVSGEDEGIVDAIISNKDISDRGRRMFLIAAVNQMLPQSISIPDMITVLNNNETLYPLYP